MLIYVGKITDEIFMEYTSHFEEFNIIVDTDFNTVKSFVLADKRCQNFGGGVEVWQNGKKIKEIDL